MKKQLITLVFAVAACAATQAQTVYRCGANYSQKPCEGAAMLEASAPKQDQAAARQAHETAVRQGKLADAMEKARLKEEAKPVAVYIPPPRAVGAAGDAKRRIEMAKPGKVQYFTAVSPGDAGEVKKKPKKKKAA